MAHIADLANPDSHDLVKALKGVLTSAIILAAEDVEDGSVEALKEQVGYIDDALLEYLPYIKVFGDDDEPNRWVNVVDALAQVLENVVQVVLIWDLDKQHPIIDGSAKRALEAATALRGLIAIAEFERMVAYEKKVDEAQSE